LEANVLIVKRNEIWLANLGERDGSEQAGKRPVLIIQNDKGNFHAPTVIVASITEAKSAHIPTHVFINAKRYQGIFKDSVIMMEQLRTIDKSKLIKRYSVLSEADIILADQALSVSLALRG
jgi:mRNA interferase MazF